MLIFKKIAKSLITLLSSESDEKKGLAIVNAVKKQLLKRKEEYIASGVAKMIPIDDDDEKPRLIRAMSMPNLKPNLKFSKLPSFKKSSDKIGGTIKKKQKKNKTHKKK